jgi:hypothetical protein
VDDLRIYDRELSPAEAAYLAGGNPGFLLKTENRSVTTPITWQGDGKTEATAYLVESDEHLDIARNKMNENGGKVYFRQTADTV